MKEGEEACLILREDEGVVDIKEEDEILRSVLKLRL